MDHLRFNNILTSSSKQCASGDHGRTMMLGEYTSMTTIHDLLPHLVPTPRGWGKYKATPPDTFFFLSDFVDMKISAPDSTQFAAQIAELHRKGASPEGKFGFPVTTCDGRLPHTVAWEDSWATFFAKLINGVLKLDIEANGPWPEFERAAEQVIAKVIPRLCGVLQSEGRQIKASLIHGDLWDGNVGTRVDTQDVILFDAGSYYAHNGMDLGQWRCEWNSHLRSKVYFKEYIRNFDAAEPVEEWEDRNRLYSLKHNLNYSSGHPGSVARWT